MCHTAGRWRCAAEVASLKSERETLLGPAHIAMTAIAKPQLLRQLAKKYVWWKSTREAMRIPQRVAAQVMNLGDFEDARALERALGLAGLRLVLRAAEAGQFNARSWHYWHYRLGLAEPGGVPPLPVRKTG